MKNDEFHQHIPKEMVDYAYTAMEEIESREPLRNKNILLYGGEPLLAENREIIEYILYEGKKRGYKFKAITNGYDLNYFIDLLSPELINDIQITIDGTKDYHNKRRIHYKKLPTFDKIIDNIELALKTNIKVSVRVNNDNKNLNDFLSLKEYFKQRDFFTFPLFNVYSSLLWNSTSISEDEKLLLDFSTSKQYISRHKEMDTVNYCKDYGIFHSIYQALTKGKPIHFKSVFCSSQAGGYVFDPLGGIYPCLEVVGNIHNRIGDYGNGKIKWNQEALEKWRNYDITHNTLCHSCKYALLCGGGCVAHALSGEREHCSYFRAMFDISVNRAFKKAFK